ncbi:low temperature requirement protein LtrA [Hydromonas duriensis]|uniref:Low temperature requirement protein LtrA n=2 Tax=Hydromonas duriensis TaxID=1527608 RepID=A0A4R6YB17_9BURK|nr:low temperature requirement protein LtrA [Hydromonas duriensis]
MLPRSKEEVHRASTPLELLFDLVFVVAVAGASANLHHSIAENHLSSAIFPFLWVFFGIWWAWMNFSWFASAYDIDDVPYRILVLVQLTGALVVAAGVSDTFSKGTSWFAITGYTIMRVAQITQWVRAWLGDPPRRQVITRYIVGLFLAQIYWWLIMLAPMSLKPYLIGFGILIELSVPFLAEKVNGGTPWHPKHIIERYSLFTIIVLGETILSASTAVQSSIDAGYVDGSLVGIIIGGLLLVFNMWWSYFQQTEHNITNSHWQGIFWGYGHYFIFVSAAAVGAGLASSVDFMSGQSMASLTLTNAVIAIPVICYFLTLALVHGRLRAYPMSAAVLCISTVLIALCIWSQSAVLLIGLIISASNAFKLWHYRTLSF